MGPLRKLLLQLLSQGTDFVTKTRVANEAAMKMASELSKREYSRLLFTNAYPELGDLSASLLSFSEQVRPRAGRGEGGGGGGSKGGLAEV